MTSLDHVLLSHPSLVSLADDSPSTRSWIQVARTGSFTSNRYGKFSITREDLAQMLHNFRHVTPASPTELPVDYDHLSMSPQRPGDGVAAGWFKQLELRDGGETLWGEIEWTPDGADHIRNKRYRFISPSFVKDHVSKTGAKIGTTLLAAAVTNHPFLENMAAITLADDQFYQDVKCDVGLCACLVKGSKAAVALSEIGQRVSFHEDPSRTPEVPDEWRGQTLEVVSIIGDGDDAFLRLKTLDGQVRGWFRVDQLGPASAEAAQPKPFTKEKSIVTENLKATVQEHSLSAQTLQLSARFEARNAELRASGLLPADAWTKATAEMPDARDAYRRVHLGADIDPTPAPVGTINLSVRSHETPAALVARVATEMGLTHRAAARVVAAARPNLFPDY